MNSKPQYGLLVSLAVVALFGTGAYYFIVAVIDKLNAVNSDLGKAIVAGAIAIAGAILSLVVGKAWEQRIKIQQELREKKAPVYEKQIGTFFAAMFAQKTGTEAASTPDLQKAFMEFTEKLVIWGSPEVIRAWAAFRLHDWQNGTTAEAFMKLEGFIRAIRADLGAIPHAVESESF